jgi:hypothetical protein
MSSKSYMGSSSLSDMVFFLFLIALLETVVSLSSNKSWLNDIEVHSPT